MITITAYVYQHYETTIHEKPKATFLILYIFLKPALFGQSQGIILIESTPSGAKVFLNDKPTGKVTPYQDVNTAGEYSFRLELEDYRNYTGTFTLEPNKTESINAILTPAYGSLLVESNPVGSRIEIDGEETGKTTPALFERLSSGKYFITLSEEEYATQTQDVVINDGQQTRVLFNLEEQFGTLGVVTSPQADIFINGTKVGEGIYSGPLPPGSHIIEATRDNYHIRRESIEMSAGSEKRFMLELEPRLGKLAVMTDPPRQEIYIDGELKGQSPLIIDSIITGIHFVGVRREEGDFMAEVKVVEGELSNITLNLSELPFARIDPDIKVLSGEAEVKVSLSGGDGTAILEKGIYLGTSPDLSKPERRIIYGTGPGNYSNSLQNLTPGTKYYVKAYLRTKDGILVSEEINFTIDFISGTFTDPRDWHTYRWVRIGEQVWMAENLNYATRTGNWCYDDQSDNCDGYGRLYNWQTAMNACPPDWNLPNDAEWTQLTDFVGSNPGTKLKAKNGWNDRGNGTDDYGFSALPGGARNYYGRFSRIGRRGYWWSSTESSTTRAWRHHVGRIYGGVFLRTNDKAYGFSVRCVRDN